MPATRCAHCGLPVPKAAIRPDDEAQFCCNGCRQVFALLNGLGLTDYYRLRDVDGRGPVSAQVTGRSFADFDDAAFARDHVRATDRGTCRASLYLEGVHCAACVWLVERLPSFTPGVVSVRLDLPRAQAEVEWDPAVLPLSAVGRSFDRLGYAPHPWRRRDLQARRRAEDRTLLIKVGVAAACAMNIMVLQGALYAGEADGIEPRFEQFFRWLSLLLSLPVVGFAARPFYTAAWAGLRNRVPHVDLPIALAILSAFAYSAGATVVGHGPVWFDSISALVALLLGGRFLQGRAQRAALERSESLRGVAFVEFARLLDEDGGDACEVPVESLRPGHRVEVRSGELVPADGVVVEGESALDNAVLTGETDPVPVLPGRPVTAGATNRGARLVVEVRAVGDGTRVGALLRMVEEAAGSKPPIVRAADRWSRWFVVAVLFLSAVTAAIAWPLGARTVLERVVALLVVSCPCALALGTPVAISVALDRAARMGIFLKDAAVLERLRGVRLALLDKTGTLTAGRLEVVERDLPEDAAALAAAVESGSDHAVARALREALAGDRQAAGLPEATGVLEAFGRGVSGTVAGRRVAVGNRAHLEALGVAPDAGWIARADDTAGRGLTPILVAVDGAVRGLVALGDPLRPEAKATVEALQRRGWRVGILSGDHPAVVARVAAELGIAPGDARGGLSPEDKRDVVAVLTGRAPSPAPSPVPGAPRPGVLLVGDGVNDAAALALADVGVAVHGGTGASIAAADVVLDRAGLLPLIALELGARRTLRVISRNLGFSLCYNLAGVLLAMTGMVGPLLAAVLMPSSSLTVILSSVLGRTFAPPMPASRAGARVVPARARLGPVHDGGGRP